LAAAQTRAENLPIFSPDGNETPTISQALRQAEQGFDMVIASRMMAGAFNEEDEQRFRPAEVGQPRLHGAATFPGTGRTTSRTRSKTNGFFGAPIYGRSPLHRRVLAVRRADGFVIEYQDVPDQGDEEGS